MHIKKNQKEVRVWRFATFCYNMCMNTSWLTLTCGDRFGFNWQNNSAFKANINMLRIVVHEDVLTNNNMWRTDKTKACG